MTERDREAEKTPDKTKNEKPGSKPKPFTLAHLPYPKKQYTGRGFENAQGSEEIH